MASLRLFVAMSSYTCIAVTRSAVQDVMNAGGVPYEISNPPGSTKNWVGTPGNYSTNFNENVEGKVEYFDVYGEVQTKYSQVYWTRNAPVNLPAALVKRFEGKVMAITGYEVDQVTHTVSGEETTVTPAAEDGPLGGFSCYPSCSTSDKSVPIYNAYNHHYFGWLMGADSEIFELDSPTKWPNPTTTGVRSLPNDHGYPTNIVFKENPGGEFRKSYHGYPSGYAQLLHSPTQWVVEPMQIDTHNREFDINEQTGYKPTFLPEMDHNNKTNLHSGLSPLIECPCTDRYTLTVVKTSPIITKATCPAAIATAADCTAQVQSMGVTVGASLTINNASRPAGCLMDPVAATPGTYNAVFNSAKSTATCSPPSNGANDFVWKGPLKSSVINCAANADGAVGTGCLAPEPKYGCTGEFQGQCTWDSAEQAQKMCSAYEECQGFMCSTKYSNGKLLCFGRGNTNVVSGSSTDDAWIKVYKDTLALEGHANLGNLVNLTIKHDGTNSTITLQGPASVWFGVGLNAKEMADMPYAIIVDGTGAVSERKLVSHGPGSLLQPTVTVVSSAVDNGIRTVVLARPVVSSSYSLPTTAGELDVITAVGNTPQLAYHAARTGATITLVPSRVSSCICSPSVHEYLTYMNSSTQEFHYDCLDEPRSDMLRHGDGTGRELQNMACDMLTYHGGLRCCKHETFLTDLDQATLIPNKTDTYYLKWRYYFQEYVPATAPATPASHKHLHHWVFLIDAQVNDYEEDNANYGDSSIGRIEAHLTASQIGLEDVPAKYNKIIPHVMTPHCHAPSCIREEFWNADTNEIICNITAKYGDEKYGSVSNVFNELNYIAIPPCIFGNQPGLQTPFQISPDTNITAIKYFNNTYRHLGQMAQWTGLMVYDTDPY
eukprot:m.1637620 g.1637620  ORF g.1637620 m.1637620 type:complete len:886 (-) comp25984_c0_seq1:1972-4629(-)